MTEARGEEKHPVLGGEETEALKGGAESRGPVSLGTQTWAQ